MEPAAIAPFAVLKVAAIGTIELSPNSERQRLAELIDEDIDEDLDKVRLRPRRADRLAPCVDGCPLASVR